MTESSWEVAKRDLPELGRVMASPELPGQWPPKAYNNREFLYSDEARKIRVLCEMTEPEARFREQNIHDTIVFFGSARSIPVETANATLRKIEERLEGREDRSEEEDEELRRARAGVKLAPYYDAAVELANRMTRWAEGLREADRFIICTGGGPGMMEAANRGAQEAGGASIGLGISLPFEQSLNEYIPEELQFEFHYFFVRKYWFAYWARALVVFPGGFGTMDELFEMLTLLQTRKVSQETPIVLFGSAFWNSVVNFEALAEWGVISPDDLSLFKIIDTVDEAEAYLTRKLTELYLDQPSAPPGHLA